jgi:hypothetical protein
MDVCPSVIHRRRGRSRRYKLSLHVGRLPWKRLPVLAAVVLGAITWQASNAVGDICVPVAPSPGLCGDGGPAIEARVALPYDVAVTRRGAVLIADAGNQRIRRVSPSGTIVSVAGARAAGFSGDNGRATEAQLAFPVSVTATPGNGFLIADNGNHRIRRVSRSGKITTVAGTGTAGFSGDGGPATQAQIAFPGGIASIREGGFLIADNGNHRIREVSPSGEITTVAGTGTAGASGDGGAATAAQLNAPAAVATLPGGGFLIADRLNSRVRRVSRSGEITTVAGIGAVGFSGDGGPATEAELASPVGIAALPGDAFLIADNGNDRIRRVSSSGVISTVVGGTQPPAEFRSLRGAAFPKASAWSFYITPNPPRAATVRRRAVLKYVTTLGAVITPRVRRGRHGGLVPGLRGQRVGAGNLLLRLRRLHAGHYTIRLLASAQGRRKSDLSTLTVRRR